MQAQHFLHSVAVADRRKRVRRDFKPVDSNPDMLSQIRCCSLNTPRGQGGEGQECRARDKTVEFEVPRRAHLNDEGLGGLPSLPL